MQTTLSDYDLTAIVTGTHRDPWTVLGMQSVSRNQRTVVAVRAFLPGVTEAWVYDVKRHQRYPMTLVQSDGLFEAVFTRRRTHFPYALEMTNGQGEQQRLTDPYACQPVLPEEDLRQFHTGTHVTMYEYLGSHQKQVNGVDGTVFAVWAPHAKQVCVTGDFNAWHPYRHPMRLRQPYGIWEIFMPGVTTGARYQYTITTASGEVLTKTDPYGFHGELYWNNEMSIVADVDRFAWTDQHWLQARAHTDPLSRPVSAYEVHLGSWLRSDGEGNRFLTYRELADILIPYVKQMGFTYIELLPVAEHPYYPSWGYQVTGYYAPTSRYGEPEDFMYFVNACHRQGLGVIMDWVPAHFPKDAFSLGNFDGTCLYEHEDPCLGEHKDWGTLIFDYGRPEVKNFLLANAMFWFEKYHIDGIRVDAVASMLYLDYSRREGEWVPNKYGGRENLAAIAFVKELNALVHERFQGVMTIAEESTSWLGVTYPAYLGGLDFSFKWNLGWMNDILHYLSHEPEDRKYVHTIVPFALLYAFHEHFMIELSHDEVVHGKGSLLNKMPGDEWQKFANLRLLFGFMFGHPGKKLLFMGNEFGQRREWNHDTGLDWDLLKYAPHQGLQRYVRDLNRLYISEPALYADQLREQGFAWIDYHDFHNSVIVFLRKAGREDPHPLMFICNFLPLVQKDYRIGVPQPGQYREVLNSDRAIYGGHDLATSESWTAEAVPWQRQAYSIALTLPPLSMLVLTSAPDDKWRQELSASISVPLQPDRLISVPEPSQERQAPVVPAQVISQQRPGEDQLQKAQAAILERGQSLSEAEKAGEGVTKGKTQDSEKPVQADSAHSGGGRPQGSKWALLAEGRIRTDDKSSSG